MNANATFTYYVPGRVSLRALELLTGNPDPTFSEHQQAVTQAAKEIAAQDAIKKGADNGPDQTH